MTKTAILVCCIGPYTEPKRDGEEIWAVNTAFRKPTYQKGIDRLYVMDSLDTWVELDYKDQTFVEQVNALNCPIVTLAHFPEVPQSRAFRKREIESAFNTKYWGSGISYMIADALYDGYEKIVLHRTNSLDGSKEYWIQKRCHDFWCGYAMGMGVEIVTSDDSYLMKNHPWCAPEYGYTRSIHENKANIMLRDTLQAIVKMPIEIQGVTY